MVALYRSSCVFLLALTFLCLESTQTFGWGFFSHRRINRMAVFLLPPEMTGFFKSNIQFLSENAVNPDRRRYAVEGEAPRHFLDADVYGDSAVYKLPRYWKQAVEKYTEDTLMAYGIVPWHINKMKYRLTKAFEEKNTQRILLLAADMGHYIGDANVPLHTTENYNGQFSGQYGIHGFWESRLPELFFEDYDFFFEDKATYIERPQMRAWQAVTEAHEALDSVLSFEKALTEKMGVDKKYAFETRGNINVRVYSRDFSTAYHDMLDGQVEHRLRASVKMIADFWYTCWVDAGQPDLNALAKLSKAEQEAIQEEIKELRQQQKLKSRQHESRLSPKNPDQLPTAPAVSFGQKFWAALQHQRKPLSDE